MSHEARRDPAIDPGQDVLRSVERRTAAVAVGLRHALAGFLAKGAYTVSWEERQAEEDGYQPSLADLERFAPAWSPLVPDDAEARAALAYALSRRHRFARADVPRLRAALGLDDPPVEEAHERRFGQPLDALYAAETRWDDQVIGTPIEGWDEHTFAAIARRLEWVPLAKGEVLFRQGLPGDGLYIVIGGHLRAFAAGPGGDERLVGEIGPGESTGEMGLISGAPHSATVYASRDTELAKLPNAVFHELAAHHPAFVMHLAQEVVARLREARRPTRAAAALRTIAVVPAGSGEAGVPLAAFCERLAAALAAFGRTAIISRRVLDDQLGAGAAARLDDDPLDAPVQEWLDTQEAQHRVVLYQADATPTGWTNRCVHRSDYQLLVALAESEPAPSAAERALPAADSHTNRGRGLVLLHRDRSRPPSGTRRWLEARPVDAHYHVCLDDPADVRRLARGVTGRSVGLVLGGGGARGFVHVGVLRALRECGVPVDAVGGTSMGAIIGAQVALGWDYQTMLKIGRWAYWRTSGPGSLLDLTVPLVALYSGQGMLGALRRIYGDVQIEDLWTPFFSVSSSLTRGAVVVHRAGPLSRYVRASASVAGVFPPVNDGGELLIDGGVLNNLPADVMRELCPHGTVVAVNADPRIGLTSRVAYGDALMPWQLLRPWLRTGIRQPPVPLMAEVLERATSLRSIEQSALLERTVIDLYFHPETDDIPFIDYRALERLAERGYRYALPIIEAWKAAHAGESSAW